MGTAKSDDESDVSAHPLAENRPGVYVQVVAPRRRKKNKRGESASSSRPPAGKARGGVREETDARVRARRRSDPRVAESDDSTPVVSSVPPLSKSGEELGDLSGPPSEAPTVVGRFAVPDMGANPAADPVLTVAGAAEETEEDDGRQSGERPVDFESMRAGEGAPDNTNQRADLLGVSIPPPPRLPSFGHSVVPSERDSAAPALVHSASLLDAPPTLRPGAQESTHAARASATLLAFVAVFTAIIVAAGLVALRELTKRDEPAARETRAAIVAPAEPAPAVVPAPTPPASAAVTTAASTAASAAPEPAPERAAPTPAALPAPAPVVSSAVAPRTRARPAAAKKAAAGRALVAKANAALRQLSSTGIKATPHGEPEPELAAEEEADEAEEEERAPNPGEPLELPFNPY